MQGYDKFFKEARKAGPSTETSRPQPRPKAARPQASASQSSSEQRRFKMSAGQVTANSPEERLKKIVRERSRKQREVARRKRAPFPVGAFVTVALGLVLAGTGVVYPESVDWVLTHVEIGAFGSANAAEEKAAPTGKTGEKTAAGEEKGTAKTAATGDGEKTAAMPDTRQWTPEEVSFFNKLSSRKRELDLRETELNKLEEELQKQKVELDEKIKQLETMRTQIAQTLKTRVESDQQKVSKLVEVYSGMKPQQAAKVIETLNEDLAVQILDQMKKKSAAGILNVMTAQKAQRLSEMLAGYKKPE